ncbi:hypothetical protein RhiirA5_438222 [Rhizophagus irregularis]|uniref:Uncharacterized protein n=1 Tax=Rhizophagus irregularis TaxID=588596 RepID=A0A2N0NJE7_9GLOM|nr:hypothetical protein RhiirA5_438225 [Rhizophagus irregularis]PKB94694.1 hypothetical protein RhiirA5_438222 [Rhizophagus irregularis]PKC53211.1 hypothetical protein RhiirA1_479759 [Rhizophagus irregularis]
MAILAGLLYYQESVVDTSTSEETTPGKHILKLDDISLISRSTPCSKRGRVTLSQLSPTRKTQANH